MALPTINTNSCDFLFTFQWQQQKRRGGFSEDFEIHQILLWVFSPSEWRLFNNGACLSLDPRKKRERNREKTKGSEVKKAPLLADTLWKQASSLPSSLSLSLWLHPFPLYFLCAAREKKREKMGFFALRGSEKRNSNKPTFAGEIAQHFQQWMHFLTYALFVLLKSYRIC